MLLSPPMQEMIDEIPSLVSRLESEGESPLHRYLLFVNEQYRKFDSLDGLMGEWGLYYKLVRPQLQTAYNRLIAAQADALIDSFWSGR